MGAVTLSDRLQAGALRQEGSLRAMVLRPYGPAPDAVILNAAGGLTGGDRMRLEARAEAGRGSSCPPGPRNWHGCGRCCPETAGAGLIEDGLLPIRLLAAGPAGRRRRFARR